MNKIVPKLSFADYRKAEGVSKSLLDKMHPTPAHCKAYMDGDTGEDESTALLVGRIVHAVSLESFNVDGLCHVKPEGMKFSTTDGRKWRDDHQDKPIVTHADAQMIGGVCKSIREHKQVRHWIASGHNELSLFADHKETGLQLKCRVDNKPNPKLFQGAAPLTDLKTALSGERHKFEKEIRNRRLYVQAALYIDVANQLGMSVNQFVFVVIEKEPPYAIALYELDDAYIEAGRTQYQRDLRLFALCKEKNEWPAYSETPDVITAPEWLKAA